MVEDLVSSYDNRPIALRISLTGRHSYRQQNRCSADCELMTETLFHFSWSLVMGHESISCQNRYCVDTTSRAS